MKDLDGLCFDSIELKIYIRSFIGLKLTSAFSSGEFANPWSLNWSHVGSVSAFEVPSGPPKRFILGVISVNFNFTVILFANILRVFDWTFLSFRALFILFIVTWKIHLGKKWN